VTVKETKEEAEERAKKQKRGISRLPLLLRMTEKVNSMVKEAGGGFRITSWKELVVPLLASMKETLEAQTKEASSSTPLLRNAYRFTKYRTDKRMAHLSRLKEPFKGNTDAKHKMWHEFLSTEGALWGEVPDATFLAAQWYRKLIKPEVHRQLKKVNGVDVPGLTSLQTVKRNLQRLAVGQWHSKLHYEGGMPLPKLMKKFEKGYYPIGNVIRTKVNRVAKEEQYLDRHITSALP
jgi:hypothetical protein